MKRLLAAGTGVFIIVLFSVLFTHKLGLWYSEEHLEEEAELLSLPYKTRKIVQAQQEATPEKYWEQNFEATKDPSTGQYHVDRVVAAWQRMQKDFSSTLSRGTGTVSLSTMRWIERGPSNVSGRTRAIMIDPNDPTRRTVWAGGVNGGIWKTTNIQNAVPNWQKIDDFLTVLSISWLTFDPLNPTIFYASTGEGYGNGDAASGAGVFKSTDAGASWQQMPATANIGTCQRVLVTKRGTLIVATRFSGFLRFTNDNTFATVLANGTVSGASSNFAYDIEEAEDSTLYATLAGSIHRSFDDGITWSPALPVPSGVRLDRVELASAPSDPTYIYAIVEFASQVEAILKSTNKGAFWTSMPEPVGLGMPPDDISRGQAWYDLCVDVSPSNRDLLFVGGIDLYKSSDGAATWTMVSQWFGGFGLQEVHADQHIIMFDAQNGEVCYFGNDGGVYRTTNASALMPLISSRKDNYNVTQFYACALHPGQNVEYMLAGAQDNGSQRFNRAGLNRTFEVTGGDGAFCHIHQFTPNIQWTSSQFNSYNISSDGGLSFISAPLIDNSAFFINPSDYDNRGNVMYLADQTPGTFFRWIDPTRTGFQRRVTVTAFGSGVVTSVYVSDSIARRVYFGLSNGRIVRVQNVDSNAIAVTSGTWLNQGTAGMQGVVSSITENPRNPNHLMATYSSQGVVSVWESRNGGATWQSVEGNLANFDIPFRTVLIHPTNSFKAMVGSELGIWATDSLMGNATVWFPANTGLANTRVTMLQRRSSDNFVIASTHGRGLYSTEIFMRPFAAFTGPQAHYTNSPYRPQNRSRNAISAQWTVANQFVYTGESPVHTFPSIGSYSIRLSINNGQDSTEIPNYVKILPDLATSYAPEMGGDFESNPEHFGTESFSGSRFERSRSTIAGKNGTYSGLFAYVLAPGSNQYASNTEARVYTPAFDFSDNAFYSFSFFTKYITELFNDGLFVEYSVDKGQTWQLLGKQSEHWYNHTNTRRGSTIPENYGIFTGNQSEFVNKFIDVTFLKGNPHVAFRFTFLSDPAINRAGVVIDNVRVSKSFDAVSFPDFDSNSGLVIIETSPTVFNNDLKVVYQSHDTSPVQFNVYTVKGQRLYQTDLQEASGLPRTVILNLSDLAEGMYVIQLRSGDRTATRKVIKSR